ncbi:hypothetical protein AOLI_G00192660 [Acnodon oligacanthus]
MQFLYDAESSSVHQLHKHTESQTQDIRMLPSSGQKVQVQERPVSVKTLTVSCCKRTFTCGDCESDQ